MADKRPNAVLENVRLAFKNFGGAVDRYNPMGKREFSIILTQEQAENMASDGWNVKYLKPRDEDEEPTPYVQVEASYKVRAPQIHLVAGRRITELGESSVGILDWAEIINVDVILHPYEWAVDGKAGVKAYLQSMYVTIEQDVLAAKYADFERVDD